MSDIKKVSDSKGINAVTAGVIGAAVGAVAVALANKDNQKKIGSAIRGMTEKGSELTEKAKTKIGETRERIGDMKDDIAEDISKKREK